MMSLWDALRMNMMISYQELVRTFLSLSWNAEKSNPGANRFYQALGGRINDHIVNYYLHGESLSKLASGI